MVPGKQTLSPSSCNITESSSGGTAGSMAKGEQRDCSEARARAAQTRVRPISAPTIPGGRVSSQAVRRGPSCWPLLGLGDRLCGVLRRDGSPQQEREWSGALDETKKTRSSDFDTSKQEYSKPLRINKSCQLRFLKYGDLPCCNKCEVAAEESAPALENGDQSRVTETISVFLLSPRRPTLMGALHNVIKY